MNNSKIKTDPSNKEESQDINIKINSNVSIEDAEGIARAIISNFNKSSYR